MFTEDSPGVYSSGLLVAKSNAALIDEAQRAAQERQNKPEVLGLASYVRSAWDAAREAKRPVQERMFSADRARDKKYDPDLLAEIRTFGGSEIYMGISDEKSSAALSWLQDLLLSDPHDRCWGVSPTPIPEVSPAEAERINVALSSFVGTQMQLGMIQTQEQAAALMQDLTNMYQESLQQVAREQDEIIERRLADELAEASWSSALRKALDDLVTYPAAFIKGPCVRRRPRLQWGPQGRAVVQDDMAVEFNRVSPYDIYPSPLSNDIGDGYLIERHTLTRKDLESMIGVDGYDDDAIREVLGLYGNGGLSDWLWTDYIQRHEVEGRTQTDRDPEGRIEALQFWGSVQGQMLIDWGMDASLIQEPTDEYDVEVWLIGNYVIRAEANPDPLGRPPYHKASFRNKRGSFWGEGIPDILVDIQAMCNAAARSLCNNMALSSGPIVGRDVSMLPEGANISSLHPWMIIQYDGSKMRQAGQRPMDFYQPASNTAELLRIHEFFSMEADNKLGIPRYSYGSTGGTGGATGTASGLSMMLSNASRGIKLVVGNIDDGMIEPSVSRLYEWLMLYRPVNDYRGDIKLIAKGSSALVIKEQMTIRRGELLGQVNASPLYQQIIGLPAISDMLRQHITDLGLDASDIPSKDELRRNAAIQAAQAQQQALAAPAPQQQEPQPAPRNTDAAGAPAGGTDARTM